MTKTDPKTALSEANTDQITAPLIADFRTKQMTLDEFVLHVFVSGVAFGKSALSVPSAGEVEKLETAIRAIEIKHEMGFQSSHEEMVLEAARSLLEVIRGK